MRSPQGTRAEWLCVVLHPHTNTIPSTRPGGDEANGVGAVERKQNRSQN